MLYWLLIGLVAGIFAKALVPGNHREPSGWIMTILLGIAGSVMMGFITQTFLGGGRGGLIPTLFGATLGAMLIIWLARKVMK